jgi:excisionase family DNA binding protein
VVTPQTVRNYLKKGELESIRVGRALLIPEKKVHALLSFAK